MLKEGNYIEQVFFVITDNLNLDIRSEILRFFSNTILIYIEFKRKYWSIKQKYFIIENKFMKKYIPIKQEYMGKYSFM